MTDLGDVLKGALESNAMKTVDLVNLTFILHSTGPMTSNTIPGKINPETQERSPDTISHSYRAVVQLDGEEKKGAWLGGAYLTPQVTTLLDKGMLPARVKLIRDSSLEGSPYVLIDGGPQPEKPVVSVPMPPQAPQTVQERAYAMFSADKRSDAVLLEIASDAGAQVQYTPDNKLVIMPDSLDDATAARLVERLR